MSKIDDLIETLHSGDESTIESSRIKPHLLQTLSPLTSSSKKCPHPQSGHVFGPPRGSAGFLGPAFFLGIVFGVFLEIFFLFTVFLAVFFAGVFLAVFFFAAAFSSPYPSPSLWASSPWIYTTSPPNPDPECFR